MLRGFENWPMLFSLLLRQREDPALLKLHNGLHLKIRSLMDAWIIKETCLEKQYERASRDLADGWNVIDVGAGLGDFTICVARRTPHSRVYAYEPFPESFTLLQENVKLNDVQNVHAYPYAVGSQDGTLQLRFTSDEAVQHTTTSAAQDNDTLEVRSVTLAHILSQHQLDVCHYLKMDCEGAEYDILLNADPELLGKIENICLEYHDGVTPFSHDDLVTFLERHGFQASLTPNPVHAHLGYLYARMEAG
jgi:FkbM family methyltransferase